MKRLLVSALFALLAIVAVGQAAATSPEESIIIHPTTPAVQAAPADVPSVAPEPPALVTTAEQAPPAAPQLLGAQEFNPHADVKAEQPEAEDANWVSPDLRSLEGESAAEEPSAPASAIPDAWAFASVEEGPVEVAEETSFPAAEPSPSPIRPVGPEQPSKIEPVGPEKPQPDITPVGPEVPEEPRIRPVGPEEATEIVPVGPEQSEPHIRPIGPEVPTEVTPTEVAPEEIVPIEIDLDAVRRDAKEMKKQLLGGLGHIFSSLFGRRPSPPSDADAAVASPPAEVSSEPFEGGVLTTSTQRLPDGGVMVLREFRAGGPLVEQDWEAAMQAEDDAPSEEGEEAQALSDVERTEAENEDVQSDVAPPPPMPALFAPFHGLLERFFGPAAPPRPFLHRGMFDTQDADALPQLQTQEHIEQRKGGCKKHRQPLLARLRRMFDEPREDGVVPPPPPMFFGPPPHFGGFFHDGPRHRRHHGHGHRHGHGRRHRARLGEGGEQLPEHIAVPLPLLGDEQDEAEFEGWPELDSEPQVDVQFEWPATAAEPEPAILIDPMPAHLGEASSIQSAGEQQLLGGEHDFAAHRHHRRASWAHRNRAWLWAAGGVLVLLAVVALAVLVRRAVLRKRRLAQQPSGPMVLFSAPGAQQFERLYSDGAQQVPEHEISNPYARLSGQDLPSAQLQMAAPLLPQQV